MLLGLTETHVSPLTAGQNTGTHPMRVLLIEDHIPLARALKQGLVEEGYAVDVAHDGEEGNFKARTATTSYDVIILDLMLPKIDGLSLLQQWRRDGIKTHVLVLTAKDSLQDKIRGLDLGADDYLTKPFFMRELLMRINALIKRNINTKEESSILIADDIIINTKTKTVQRQDQFINLTPREYQILLMLIKNKSEIVSKKDLIKEIWGESIDINTNTIEVYINFLRNKLDKPFNKNSIKNKIGYGYYIDIE